MTRYTWNGGNGDNLFGTAGNWSPGGGPPGAADIAMFTDQNAGVAGDATVGRLLIDATTSVQFTGSLSVLGLDTQAAMVVGNGAEVTFDRGSALSVAGRLVVGRATGGRSTLRFDGATVNTAGTVIGQGPGSTGEVGITDTVWETTGQIAVGAGGLGDLGIGAGSLLVVGNEHHPDSGRLLLGAQAGGVGEFSVSDGGIAYTRGVVQLGGAPGVASHGIGQISVTGGGDLYSFNDISVADGSSISVADGYVTGFDLSVAYGGTVSGSGSVGAQESFVNDGAITASGALLIDGTVSGTGTMAISAGSELILPEVVQQAAISFIGSDGTLLLPQFLDLTAPIEGFVAGDQIMAPYANHMSFDAATDVLTLKTNSMPEGQVTLVGDYTGAVFHDSYSGSVGTITVTMPHGHG